VTTALNVNQKEFAAQTAVQNGLTRDSRGFTYASMTTVSNGTTSSGVIKLQGSADGTNWYDLATRTLAASGSFNDAVTGAHRYFRVGITTVIGGGGTVDVWLTLGGHGLPNDGGYGGA
jgi:hypothetical protein